MGTWFVQQPIGVEAFPYQLVQDAWGRLQPACVYMVGQPEVCPTTARVHYQFFLIMRQGVSVDTMRKRLAAAFGSAVHTEVAVASTEACVRYCTKEPHLGTRIEFGRYSCHAINHVVHWLGSLNYVCDEIF